MADPRVKRVEVNGLRLQVIVWGDESLPAVVYFPGTGGTGWDFENVANVLSDRYCCFGVTPRGHGDSDRAPDDTGYLPQAFRDDIPGVLDALGVRRPVLAGSSLGAGLALWYAADEPDAVAGLVMDDDPPEVPARHLERVIRTYLERGHPVYEDRDAVTRWYEKYRIGPPFNWPISPGRLQHVIDNATTATPAGKLTLKWDIRLMAGMLEGITRNEGDLWDRFANVHIPVLVLEATEGKTCLPEHLERMKTLNPTLEYHSFEGAGHPLIMTRQREFIELLEAFLASPVVGARRV
jgi:pimeloyl-ACP methyl ester carboxylesterase